MNHGLASTARLWDATIVIEPIRWLNRGYGNCRINRQAADGWLRAANGATGTWHCLRYSVAVVPTNYCQESQNWLTRTHHMKDWWKPTLWTGANGYAQGLLYAALEAKNYNRVKTASLKRYDISFSQCLEGWGWVLPWVGGEAAIFSAKVDAGMREDGGCHRYETASEFAISWSSSLDTGGTLESLRTSICRLGSWCCVGVTQRGPGKDMKRGITWHNGRQVDWSDSRVSKLDT